MLTRDRDVLKLKAKSDREKSEKEIRFFLEQQFGAEDIETDPKVGVGDKKADFRVKSIDTYVEVTALKDIKHDQWDILSQEKNITQMKLKDNGHEKILDRIASKLLHKCAQLPEGKRNLIVTKTEGISLFPEEVIEAITGTPYVSINKENMQTSVGYGTTGFRSKEELQKVLEKISAILAYKSICQHSKLSGKLGNNKNNAGVPFDDKTLAVFQNFLCDKCQT